MAGRNIFSTRIEQRLPLYAFLIQRHDVLVENPVRTLRSIVECLKQIHDLGRAHGAVCAQRMLVSSEGMLDAEFFAARDGQREPLKAQEVYSYYPNGTGTTLEERQQSDVRALTNVLHLIVLGHEPTPVQPNSNNRQWGQPIEAPWPPLFLQYAAALFTHGPQAIEAPLQALMQSLEAVHSNNGESMATDVALSPGSRKPLEESPSKIPVSEILVETQEDMRRLPVYLLIDTSGSMKGEPLESVKSGLQAMLGGLRRDPHARESLCLSIITFDREVKVVLPLSRLEALRLPAITCPDSGPTNLGAALELLCDRVDKEVRRTQEENKGDWKPIAFIMTDGSPSDIMLYKEMIPKVKSRGFASIVACAAGPKAKKDELASLADHVVTLETMDGNSFLSFFRWVSSSVAAGNVGVGTSDELHLPPPPPEVNLVF